MNHCDRTESSSVMSDDSNSNTYYTTHNGKEIFCFSQNGASINLSSATFNNRKYNNKVFTITF